MNYGGPYQTISPPNYHGRPPPARVSHNQPPSYSSQGSQQHNQQSYPPQAANQGGQDAQLRAWFASVDTNRSGSINPHELQAALVNGNWEPFDLDTIKMLLNMFDRDRSGGIGFQEFASLWQYIGEWQNVFRRFDADRSGSMQASELGAALGSFGYSLSPRLTTILELKYGGYIKSGGRSKGITFDRFVRCCVTVRYLTEAFKDADVQSNGQPTGRATLSYEQFMSICISAP